MEPIGDLCEVHKTELHDNCIMCGAPVCCRFCCREALLEQDAHRLKAENTRLLGVLEEIERVLGPSVPDSVTDQGAHWEWREALDILARIKPSGEGSE